MVSSDDFGLGDSRRDAKAHPFYDLIATSPPSAEAITASDDGAFRIRMSGGYTLEVRPTAGIEPDEEQWRLMPRDEQQDHVVLWGDGHVGP